MTFQEIPATTPPVKKKQAHALNTRDRGEFSELKFSMIAIEMGLRISKPIFSGLPYDFIVDKDGSLFKIQIKSTANFQNKKYSANLAHGNKLKKEYCPKEVDCFGVHIVPLDLWYIFSIHDTVNKAHFSTNPEDPKDHYYKYINNWSLFDSGEKRIITKASHRRSTGNIFTDHKCPICKGNLLYDPERRGCFCKDHPEEMASGRYRVCFGSGINKRFENIKEAETLLNELRTKF